MEGPVARGVERPHYELTGSVHRPQRPRSRPVPVESMVSFTGVGSTRCHVLGLQGLLHLPETTTGVHLKGAPTHSKEGDVTQDFTRFHIICQSHVTLVESHSINSGTLEQAPDPQEEHLGTITAPGLDSVTVSERLVQQTVLRCSQTSATSAAAFCQKPESPDESLRSRSHRGERGLDPGSTLPPCVELLPVYCTVQPGRVNPESTAPDSYQHKPREHVGPQENEDSVQRIWSEMHPGFQLTSENECGCVMVRWRRGCAQTPYLKFLYDSPIVEH
ncbi:unnamed protein product [Pleuronectes platessa]|uniref:Uncharacterized protein n=1 Tax=Pleuronectes platessa TaxID=8262 RepID=A0A9N7VUZ3_PLEPL|nr:unnamed protein product [Pleuronectes platessa]